MNRLQISRQHSQYLARWLVCLSLGVLAGGLSCEAQAEVLTKGDLQAEIDGYAKRHRKAVVVARVLRPDGDLFVSAGEFEREGELQAPDENSVFAIASVTKTFTAGLLAVLASKNMLQLDDPASMYLPEKWRLPDEKRDAGTRQITLRELATHHSGLPVQPPTIAIFALSRLTPGNPYSQFNGDELAKTMKSLPLENAVGTKYVYSNLGTGLLGHALAGAAKEESYESALRKHVLEPLELNDTVIRVPEEMRVRVMPTFNSVGDRAPSWGFATLEACGGLRSTCHDLTRWVRFHWGEPGDPLNGVLATTLEPQFPQPVKPHSRELVMGLGWHLIALPEDPAPEKEAAPTAEPPEKPVVRRVAFHNGATTAGRSFIAFDAKKKVGVVLLANVPHSLDKIGMRLIKRLVDEHPAAE